MPRDVTKRPPSIESLASLLGPSYKGALAENFPDIVPAIYPCGANLLIQLRTPTNYITLSNGQKFYKPDESTDAEQARTQTGLVRALGPVAFHNRNTMEQWPEGDWCAPGWFIRVPMYGGDRVFAPVNPAEPNGSQAIFLVIRDTDCLAIVTGDPLGIKAG